MVVKIAKEQDIEKLILALLELRPHRTVDELREMLKEQFKEGFQVIYIGDEDIAYAVAGYRTIQFLFSGKTLYIDDLVTHSGHRKKGYAGMLLNWLIQFARENNYEHISLDSGFKRKDAHRLYLNHGLEINSLHFGRNVVDLI